MPSCTECSSRPSAPSRTLTAPSIFAPAFLTCLDERDEVPTTWEADLAGPWRTVPVPGRPGWVGVLRAWESLEEGDAPRAVFDQEELALLCTAAFPVLGRDLLFHLGESAREDGYPMMDFDGEHGPRVRGALALYQPEVAAALHLLQGLVRSPAALAAVLEAAGPGAVAQVGRILARRWEVGR